MRYLGEELKLKPEKYLYSGSYISNWQIVLLSAFSVYEFDCSLAYETWCGIFYL